MPSLAESGQTAQTPFAAAAQAGVDTLSIKQAVTFDLYNRVVLSADGMVYWVKVTPTVAATTQLTVLGSLHYATVNTQDADANISQNQVVFTAEAPVNELNQVAETSMWIAVLDNGVKYAFSQRGSWYEQAGLWHYRGMALYADMQTQVIDNPTNVPSSLIVSNSLPIWLFLSSYVPSGPAYGFSNPFALYPSFLVPDNLNPATTPYGAVDIPPELTESMQGSALLNSVSSQYQLTKDIVRITLYGGTNAQAWAFVGCVNQYSVDYGAIGLMNSPTIRDMKRTQAEFSTIAMKKTIQFEVSYIQASVLAVARQLILQAAATNYIL
jgi:hypothetical protein